MGNIDDKEGSTSTELNVGDMEGSWKGKKLSRCDDELKFKLFVVLCRRQKDEPTKFTTLCKPHKPEDVGLSLCIKLWSS